MHPSSRRRSWAVPTAGLVALLWPLILYGYGWILGNAIGQSWDMLPADTADAFSAVPLLVWGGVPGDRPRCSLHYGGPAVPAPGAAAPLADRSGVHRSAHSRIGGDQRRDAPLVRSGRGARRNPGRTGRVGGNPLAYRVPARSGTRRGGDGWIRHAGPGCSPRDHRHACRGTVTAPAGTDPTCQPRGRGQRTVSLIRARTTAPGYWGPWPDC